MLGNEKIRREVLREVVLEEKSHSLQLDVSGDDRRLVINP